MVTVISNNIIRKAKISLEEGQNAYRGFFGGRKLYEKYREQVEAILIEKGYEDVIVPV